MSKLNPKNVAIDEIREVAFSQNGNLQFVKGPTQQLFETVVATLYGKDGFYETTDDRVERMKAAVKQIVLQNGDKGAEFVGRVALFARQDMNIRTMPIILVVELMVALREAKINVAGMRKLVTDVIQRADQLTDLFSYALTVFGEKKSIPMSIKKGVADAFNKFDAYQFAKYNRDDTLKFKNLLRIVHPSPRDELRAVIFQKIMDETLESPHTWEVELSKNGQLGDEKQSDKDLWTRLVNHEGSGSIGYMALLRNLRNIHQAGVDHAVMQKVCNKISDPAQVLNSKQLPMAFFQAYEVAKEGDLPQYVLSAISDAMDTAIGNLPAIGLRPWIIMDVSSSMSSFDYHSRGYGPRAPLARGHDKTSPAKIAAIFAASLIKASKKSEAFKFTMFSISSNHHNLNPNDSILSLYEQIMKKVSGGGTNIKSALALKPNLGFEPDAVAILSDMEVNNMAAGHYGCLDIAPAVSKLFAKDAVLLAVNINSGSTTPLDPRDGWIQLAGFSPKIFDYVDYTRRGDSVVKQLLTGELPRQRKQKVVEEE